MEDDELSRSVSPENDLESDFHAFMDRAIDSTRKKSAGKTGATTRKGRLRIDAWRRWATADLMLLRSRTLARPGDFVVAFRSITRSDSCGFIATEQTGSANNAVQKTTSRVHAFSGERQTIKDKKIIIKFLFVCFVVCKIIVYVFAILFLLL